MNMANGRAQYQKHYRTLVNKVTDWLSKDVDNSDAEVLHPPGESNPTTNKRVELELMEVQHALSSSEDSVEIENSSNNSIVSSCCAAEFLTDNPPISSSDEELQEYDQVNEIPIMPEGSLKSELACWVMDAHLSRDSCNSLLAMLRRHGCQVPKDSRTLLKTPRTVAVTTKCGGQYLYFGMQKVLHAAACLGECPDVLEIQVNVDGLPLFKSSNAQLWPILCSVNSLKPMIVALYMGDTKPKSVAEYLMDFIAEVGELQANGFTCSICGGTERRTVFLHSVVCDAPARAFLKNIKGHNSLHGCERCVALGTSINSRTTFSSADCFNAEKRCNEKFKNNEYLGAHQHGPTPLCFITSNCVDICALDYMHLVCLGTVRRMLHYWKNGDRIVKLSSGQILQISDKLISLRSFIPSDFARRPRSLMELDRWKATELRQFLLYTGPVVLKSVLPPQLYKHFLTLSIAMSVLLMQDDAKRLRYLTYAAKLLHHFVFNCEILYGETFLVYNIHSLLHLAEDVQYFKTNLDNVSAFPYENYLKTLKRLVRSASNPIAQIAKRIEEYEAVNTEPFESVIKLSISHMKVSSKYVRDSVIMLKSGKFAEVLNRTPEQLKCNVYHRKSLQPFYTEPCSSELLNIYFVTDQPKNYAVRTVVWEQVECKGMKMPCGNGFVLLPLLHREIK